MIDFFVIFNFYIQKFLSFWHQRIYDTTLGFGDIGTVFVTDVQQQQQDVQELGILLE